MIKQSQLECQINCQIPLYKHLPVLGRGGSGSMWNFYSCWTIKLVRKHWLLRLLILIWNKK